MLKCLEEAASAANQLGHGTERLRCKCGESVGTWNREAEGGPQCEILLRPRWCDPEGGGLESADLTSCQAKVRCSRARNRLRSFHKLMCMRGAVEFLNKISELTLRESEKSIFEFLTNSHFMSMN